MEGEGGEEEETRCESCLCIHAFVSTTSGLQDSSDSTTGAFGGRKKEQSTWQMPLMASVWRVCRHLHLWPHLPEGCAASFASDSLCLKGVLPPLPLLSRAYFVASSNFRRGQGVIIQPRKETRWYAQWHQWLPKVLKQQQQQPNRKPTNKQTNNPMLVTRDSQGRQQQHSGWPFPNFSCVYGMLCVHSCTYMCAQK